MVDSCMLFSILALSVHMYRLFGNEREFLAIVLKGRNSLSFPNSLYFLFTYPFSLCPRKCGRKGELKKHKAVVHEDKKLFECSLCSYVFCYEDHLKQHIASVHDWIRMWRGNEKLLKIATKMKRFFRRRRKLVDNLL